MVADYCRDLASKCWSNEHAIALIAMRERCKSVNSAFG